MAHCKKNYISRFQQWYFICTFIVPLYWGIRCWNEIDKHSKTKHDFKAKTFNQKMNQLIRITFSKKKKIPNILVLFFQSIWPWFICFTYTHFVEWRLELVIRSGIPVIPPLLNALWRPLVSYRVPSCRWCVRYSLLH